jgi:hypothetical protein
MGRRLLDRLPIDVTGREREGAAGRPSREHPLASCLAARGWDAAIIVEVDQAERAVQERCWPWAPASVDDIRRWFGDWARPALHEHLGGRFHLWSVGSGSLRPPLFPAAGIHTAELPQWAGQVWVRRRSTEPWLVDVVTTKDRDGRRTSRLDPDLALRLEEVVWVPEAGGPLAGVRVQRPEFVLAHKARHGEPKDQTDLESTLPLLDARALASLHDLVARAHPGHPWLARIASHTTTPPT